MTFTIDLLRRWRDRLNRIADTAICDEGAAYRIMLVAVLISFGVMGFQNWRFNLHRKELQRLSGEHPGIITSIHDNQEAIQTNQESIESLLRKFDQLDQGQEEIKLNQEELKRLHELLRDSLSHSRAKVELPHGEVLDDANVQAIEAGAVVRRKPRQRATTGD